MSILLALLAGAGVNVGAITGATLLGIPAIKVAKALTYTPTVLKALQRVPIRKHVPSKAWTEETPAERDWRIINDKW